MTESCLFCGIAERKIPSTVVYENERVLGFKDVRPQAPVHVLFVPKRHLSGIRDAAPGEDIDMNELFKAANQFARTAHIADSGYRLVINSGRDGGQTVEHLHLHLLGGRAFGWPPG